MENTKMELKKADSGLGSTVYNGLQLGANMEISGKSC